MAVTARTLTLGRGTYPLVLPSLRDPRLHVASVIISVHVLGQVALHFSVSIPQILAAILTCAVIEIVLTFRRSRSFVWPASAMLTGSGVALILRVVGTAPDDHWTFDGVLVFAVVAALSLLSKYVIQWRGQQVFNPSNIGLVVTFVVLGTTRVEPLDFWWAPLGPAMIAAYAIIIGGGLYIDREVRLLPLVAAFCVTFATGIGILAASGHCMTANWAFAPVCGFDFWRTIVTSPEVMIFLVFMITDPRVVPAGRVARIAFGATVGATAVLLMAPQTDEFGAKVGLLAGLAVVYPARFLLQRAFPAPGSPDDNLRAFVVRLATGGTAGRRVARGAAWAGLAAAAALVVGAGIIVAGTPARGVVVADTTEVLNRQLALVNPGTLPPITVGQDVTDWDHELAGPGMQDVVLTLSQNRELENQALLQRDAALLPAVDHGDRLDEMRARLKAAESTGTTVIAHYAFDTISVSLLVPFGQQTGLSLGLHSRGTMVQETYDASGRLVARETSPFALTFAVRRATGARWLDVAVLPAKPGG